MVNEKVSESSATVCLPSPSSGVPSDKVALGHSSNTPFLNPFAEQLSVFCMNILSALMHDFFFVLIPWFSLKGKLLLPNTQTTLGTERETFVCGNSPTPLTSKKQKWRIYFFLKKSLHFLSIALKTGGGEPLERLLKVRRGI